MSSMFFSTAPIPTWFLSTGNKPEQYQALFYKLFNRKSIIDNKHFRCKNEHENEQKKPSSNPQVQPPTATPTAMNINNKLNESFAWMNNV